MTSTSFRGRTLDEAKLAAVASLGPEFVLQRQRRCRRRGMGGLLGASDVEIVVEPVSTLEQLAPLRSALAAARARGPFAPGAYATAESERLGVGLHDDIRVIRAMLFRLSQAASTDLKGELASLKRSLDEHAAGDPMTQRVAKLVRQSGLDGLAAKRIARAMRDCTGTGAELEEAYRDALADLISVAPWPLAEQGPRLLTLIGPPGVGKTTTAAKLGARAKVEQHESVLFVAADTWRVGAIEQLARYAALLQAGFEVARNGAELRELLARSRADVVIVDTAGLVSTELDSPVAVLGASAASGAASGRSARSRHVLLCLSAALRTVDAEAIVARYAPLGPTSLVVTKVDQTSAPGGLVHGSLCSGLPVCAFCAGHRVPEDLAPATTGAILDHLAPRGGSAERRRT